MYAKKIPTNKKNSLSGHSLWPLFRISVGPESLALFFTLETSSQILYYLVILAENIPCLHQTKGFSLIVFRTFTLAFLV